MITLEDRPGTTRPVAGDPPDPTMGTRCPNCGSYNTGGQVKPDGRTVEFCLDCNAEWNA